jgi:hypothetical protein
MERDEAPDLTGSSAATLSPDVPASRSCTRCEGEQHLLEGLSGFGKYRCLNCGMVVGFDLESFPAEFLIDRGSPGRYSRDVFGSRLLPAEQRLP